MANKLVRTSVRFVARILKGGNGYDYMGETGSAQEAIRDLLTDIRHFAKERKLDFNKAVRGSKAVAKEEDSLA